MSNHFYLAHGGDSDVASPNESEYYGHPSPVHHHEHNERPIRKNKKCKGAKAKKSDEPKQKGKRRNRRTLSCENCRSRKTRCTREDQCHQCTLRGQVCEWGPKSVKWFPRRSGQFDNAKRSTQLAANQDAIEELKGVASRLGELLSIEQPRMDALLQPPTSFQSFFSQSQNGGSELGEWDQKEEHSDVDERSGATPPKFAHLSQQFKLPGSPTSTSSQSSHHEYDQVPRYTHAFPQQASHSENYSSMLYVDQEEVITSYLDSYNGGPALYYPRYNFQGFSASHPTDPRYGQGSHDLQFQPQPYYNSNWAQ